MKRYMSVAVLAVVTVIPAGCIEFSRTASSLTGPSGSSLAVSTLAGTYRSINSITTADSCTNFAWSVTDKTANSARGTFSASCQNNTLQVSGTAEGTQTGNNIVFLVNANAVSAGISCAISLSGTAVVETNQLRVPYSGSSCFGSVSGTEILKRD
ncbi:MAG: hypothetical protein M3R55_02700 [Acidobacteriota bacterium]|nr:hypothetical protein [Acidobacteriota bacterium]